MSEIIFCNTSLTIIDVPCGSGKWNRIRVKPKVKKRDELITEFLNIILEKTKKDTKVWHKRINL